MIHCSGIVIATVARVFQIYVILLTDVAETAIQQMTDYRSKTFT